MRATLEHIPSYQAGKRPIDREDLVSYKVSSNENPYPPLPQVLAAIADAATQANRYPDPAATDLVEAIARYHGVSTHHIALGTGAVALCYQFAHCVCDPGDEVIFAWRSFEAYPIVARVTGATSVPVPLTATYQHDLAAMAAAITDRTRLIFVCSPNNPTGTVVSAQEFDEFLAVVPTDVLIVLDEAYIEFNQDPAAVSGLRIYEERPNVAVLRTFSKAYGLAGLRVGYAIAPVSIVTALKKTALPFGVSNVAQAAAIASLADDVELFERVDAIVAERDRVTGALRAEGLPVSQSQANFIWLASGPDAERHARLLEESGLTVRLFPHEGIRITIAEPPANTRLIAQASQLHPQD